MAVDIEGSVYVSDEQHGGSIDNQVVKLPAASHAQDVMPFTDLSDPRGVAVDAEGSVYVTRFNQVVKLPVGSTRETVPFESADSLSHVAVDTHGNVYATGLDKVLKFPAGST